ncbi:hypothetical protein QJS10_CPA08g00923 [Acorus calamus]|uniref:Uncharacterized protein n=1 Tax=Acorus calamus TaxID=4465 RepID=A0AAV9ECC1_ACOCL|nr:hypothetical protein QJS10_CPA08g00923 [Acorus calamus]
MAESPKRLNPKAAKRGRENKRVGKSKFLEGAKQKKENKKKTEDEVERGEGGEDSKRRSELLNKNKQLQKEVQMLQQEIQKLNKRMQTIRMDHGLLVHILQKQITSGCPLAGPSSPLMFDQGNSPFSGRDMEMSGALAVVDKLIEDYTSVVPKKKKEKQTATPMRRSERLNPQSPLQ